MTYLINKIKHPKRLWQFTLAFFMTIFTLIGAYADVSSLGFTIGKTEYNQVKKQSSGLNDIGVNKYSQGKMLKGLDKRWNIQGLQQATFIFDKKDKLTAIIMNMNKNQFDRVFGFLQTKYALVNKRVPFVGNKSALFRSNHDNVSIELTAPHMSFNMDVVYSTDRFDKAYARIKNREQQQKQQHEKSQF